MRNRIFSLLAIVVLMGATFLVTVPPADGCSATVNAGYCGKGCRSSVNAGYCGSGCSATVNAGHCGGGEISVCTEDTLGDQCSLVPSLASESFSLPFFECMNFSDDDGDGGTDWIGINKNTLPNAIDNPDQDCDFIWDNDESRNRNCQAAHYSPHSHTYGFGGSVGARSDTVTGGREFGAGIIEVYETNVGDCDGDGSPGDYDGDFETGVGGGFFGFGPWADEEVCDYRLTIHGASVVVNDVVWGSTIAFVIGADDTSGPVVTVDPVDGSTSCSTSGSITPGDPTTDPTADADDCVTKTFIGSGTSCGSGGDGGYWVFLHGAFIGENVGGVGASNSPTLGTITA